MRPSGLQIGWVWIETVWRRGRQHPKLPHPDLKGEVPSITVAGAERVTAPVGTSDAYRGEVSAAEGGVSRSDGDSQSRHSSPSHSQLPVCSVRSFAVRSQPLPRNWRR